jgi:hypothetical protein
LTNKFFYRHSKSLNIEWYQLWNMNKEEILKRKEEWIEKLKREGKIGDPKEDHKRSLDALQSPTRRETIKFIGIGNKKSGGRW